MSKTDSKDITFTNPARRFGEIFQGPAGTLSAIAASCILGLAGTFMGAATLEHEETLPDATGTELAERILDEHQQTLSDLTEQDYQFHKMKVDYDFAKLSEEEQSVYAGLKNTFSQNAQQALFDLYTRGATNDGAAMSEQDFEKQLKDLMHTINGHVDFKSINYDTRDVYPGMLDECLAETTLPKSDSTISQFNALNDIQSCMTEQKDAEDMGAMTYILLAAFVPMFGFIGLAKSTSGPLSRLPEKITIGRKKPGKHIKSNH